MNTRRKFAKLICLMMAGLTVLLAHSSRATGQQKPDPQKPQDNDVIRVSTTLVQTDVMVFDKQGKFVEGLTPEQFELKVDGKPIPISFLELVTTGSDEEKRQIAAAAKGQPSPSGGATTTMLGRSLFFLFDDLHLSSESFIRARNMLLKTIDEMNGTDRALVIASSGQLGPQQLTSDKAVLKAAIERIVFKAGIRQSIEKPPMSEYQATSLTHGDVSLMDYYVEQVWLKEVGGGMRTPREQVEASIMARARTLLDLAQPSAANALLSFETLMHDAAKLPGRKVLVFISDGFIVNDERSSLYPRLTAATREAARAGVVVYSFNAAGLQTTGIDISDNSTMDPRIARTTFSGTSATQDILYTLAADTGGRALVNNNDLAAGAHLALEETAKYYLAAWRPPVNEVAAGTRFKKIEFRVVGRPELKVRTRKDVASSVSEALLTLPIAGRPAAPAGNAELMTALNSAAPQRGLPTSLVLVYRNVTPSSFAVTASMQIPSKALSFADRDGKQVAVLDVAGIVIDQHGKQVSTFNKQVDIAADSKALDPIRKLVFYTYQTSLPPGRYEIRMGAHDSKSGAIGSAAQSVEIPDLAAGKLALSSLMLVEQAQADNEDEAGEKPEEQRGVAQRFTPDSRLQFLTFVYNATPVAANDNAPDLDVNVEVLRNDRPVAIPQFRELVSEEPTDARRFPFAGEIKLSGLTAGNYVLRVIIVDRSTEASAAQVTSFVIE